MLPLGPRLSAEVAVRFALGFSAGSLGELDSASPSRLLKAAQASVQRSHPSDSLKMRLPASARTRACPSLNYAAGGTLKNNLRPDWLFEMVASASAPQIRGGRAAEERSILPWQPGGGQKTIPSQADLLTKTPKNRRTLHFLFKNPGLQSHGRCGFQRSEPAAFQGRSARPQRAARFRLCVTRIDVSPWLACRLSTRNGHEAANARTTRGASAIAAPATVPPRNLRRETPITGSSLG